MNEWILFAIPGLVREKKMYIELRKPDKMELTNPASRN